MTETMMMPQRVEAVEIQDQAVALGTTNDSNAQDWTTSKGLTYSQPSAQPSRIVIAIIVIIIAVALLRHRDP